MNLPGFKLEALEGANDQGRQEAGAVGLEEPVQSPTQGIIAKVASRSPEGIVGLGPVLNAVKGVGLKQHALNEQLQGVAVMGVRDVRDQQGFEVQTPEEMVHQRQSSLQLFTQGQRGNLHVGNPNVYIHQDASQKIIVPNS